ncbi:undecaprenyldiphospho-muramoylpentapeptide beta-N-acetylglucosaminyltransferase [Candidatus Falkowbacteria bacterium CG11_big_fil_rev_8_21_14_0_20_39_10]|uniref:UDP-N-acetylglucosamine--N-acetylmuramyl-(pentapeptide) pyrophosphoryl-undecaprenol N-acetylglucosamine transferase n=1 Tax=Candidatus Falkowbacteria bacterium CG11_big_fil_rev_8_21_14_0_20_39_10 TaxID=1974570 RepID=A0A2M6K901_9BACT|nr:MAG: undecaprenyldiphospho-muramoylpentapeptide beta-N-acetylglucosaminyltransferase [Candidatus Falkowbacteria bacterium CG11_big_fil_rev_8_21_14_0_20_39_10]
MRYATHNKKIILTGGGTAGSVSPLLAIFEELTSLKHPFLTKEREGVRYDFLWVGTKKGIEKEMVGKAGIKFKSITSGKLRRYFSWQNFIDPFKILIGFFQSIFIVLKFKPDLVMSAGGFVSVPVVWAAWLLGVKIIIHQQDARAGLANKLMAPLADVITVTFEKSLADYGKKAVWTGNPIRQSLQITNYKLQITNFFNLKKDLPVLLVIGGGTGAMAINKLVWDSLEELTKFCQVIHICGKSKKLEVRSKNYLSFEFLEADKMAEALRLADVVVSRAGLGLLTELSYLGKPSILIPIPDSHQEDNAKIFQDKKAAVVLEQKFLTGEEFVSNIKRLMFNKQKQEEFGENIKKVIKKGANESIVKIILEIL